MKIALAQVNPIIGDLPGNVNRCLDCIHQGADLGADLVLLPEMAVTGSPPRDILFDNSFVEAAVSATADMAERSRGGPPVLVGTILPSGENPRHHPGLFIAAVFLEQGRYRLAAAKCLLRNDDVYFEGRWFLPGSCLPPLLIAGRKVGVCFAADLEEEGDLLYPTSSLNKDGAVVLACLGAVPFQRGGQAQLQGQACRLKLPFAAALLVGGNDEVIYGGKSFALYGGGGLAASLPFGEETTVLVDLEVGDCLTDQDMDPSEEVYHALVMGIRDFFHKNHIRQAFLGISGGLDSAVVAALAAGALGPEKVTAVSIPSRYTNSRSVESARQLCASLGVRFEVFDLEPLHRAAEKSMARLLDEGTGAENIQARLRAMVLMGYVNRHGGMLLNTTNKTELSVGYITLYGDMAGMLSPLGDLTKPEVAALARWIDSHRVTIPAFILERSPTAELKPGQVDPFDYAVVSPALEELVQADSSNEVLRRSEYKRRKMGVILRVSPRAFGSGRLVPVTRR